jgi:hypothetical protein
VFLSPKNPKSKPNQNRELQKKEKEKKERKEKSNSTEISTTTGHFEGGLSGLSPPRSLPCYIYKPQ